MNYIVFSSWNLESFGKGRLLHDGVGRNAIIRIICNACRGTEKSTEKETLARILYSKNNIKIIKRYNACNIFLRLKLKFLI